MPTRTKSALVAVFSTIFDAQAAVGELTANAFAEDHIHIASENTEANPATDTRQTRSAGHVERDVESWCKSTFGENQEAKLERYETAVRDGNVLLGLDTPGQMVDTASDILNHHSPVDLAQHGTAAQSTVSSIVSKTADQRELQPPAETDTGSAASSLTA